MLETKRVSGNGESMKHHALLCALLSTGVVGLPANAIDPRTLKAESAAPGEDWLQWGGPKRDFTVDVKGLAEKWPEGGPKRLWKRPLGDGYSAILCRGDELFTVYHDKGDEVVVSLDARTGTTKWEHRKTVAFWPDMTKQFGPGPNATPLVMGSRIMHVGIDGWMRCLDVASGTLLWEHDLSAQFGRKKRVEEYGYSGSPLPYRDTAIVLVGGEQAGVVAFNPADGAVVWKSEPGGISYAPPTITSLGGQEQFIFFEPEGVVALDPATGRTLWRSGIEFDNGNHLTAAVQCDEQNLWVGSQFPSGGGRLLRVTNQGETWQAEKVWFERKLQASHWTSIRIGDFVYGSIGGNDVSFLSAFHWRTGKTAWRERGFHKAQALYADGKLLFLDEGGTLAIAKVSPERLQVLDKAKITDSVSWTLPTLASTKLFVRDRKNILALDLAPATP